MFSLELRPEKEMVTKVCSGISLMLTLLLTGLGRVFAVYLDGITKLTFHTFSDACCYTGAVMAIFSLLCCYTGAVILTLFWVALLPKI